MDLEECLVSAPFKWGPDEEVLQTLVTTIDAIDAKQQTLFITS